MPKYWLWLASKLADGSVVTHKKIYGEVVKGAEGEKPSPLSLWVKSRKGAWCSYGCTDESKVLMGKISEYCINKYGFPTAKKFLVGGDAHLISRAANDDDGIVVTQESVLHFPRIPSVCDHFGIKHLPMNRMNIELKMKF